MLGVWLDAALVQAQAALRLDDLLEHSPNCPKSLQQSR
jgi:hypothetical protein